MMSVPPGRNAGADQDVPFHLIPRPAWSTAKQKDEVGQETEVKVPTRPPVDSIWTGDDQDSPFHVMALPPSTAVQNDVVGHETDVSDAASMFVGADHDPPFHVSALPPASTATQNEAVAHDTETRLLAPSILDAVDHTRGTEVAPTGAFDTDARTKTAEVRVTATPKRTRLLNNPPLNTCGAPFVP